MAETVRALPYFFILLTLNAVHDVRGQSGSTPGTGNSGTTPEIEETFKSRCSSFQKQNPDPFINNPKNCSLLWELFLNSFANKSSCAISPENYTQFLLEANHTAAIKDQAMFWAFTSPFVYNFTASQPGQYMTILDLLPGYTLDNLTWCWNSSINNLDYNSCPSYKSCPNEHEAVRSFWKANSKMFAGLATGQVFAMLNGSTDGAYTNRSLFNTVEVPAMHNPPITTMQVILVHNLGGPFRENCYNGTLVQLQSDISSKSIKFNCTEDPPEVKSLQCRLYPEYADYCPASGAPDSTVASIVIYQSFTIVVLFLVKFIG